MSHHLGTPLQTISVLIIRRIILKRSKTTTEVTLIVNSIISQILVEVWTDHKMTTPTCIILDGLINQLIYGVDRSR